MVFSAVLASAVPVLSPMVLTVQSAATDPVVSTVALAPMVSLAQAFSDLASMDVARVLPATKDSAPAELDSVSDQEVSEVESDPVSVDLLPSQTLLCQEPPLEAEALLAPLDSEPSEASPEDPLESESPEAL